MTRAQTRKAAEALIRLSRTRPDLTWAQIRGLAIAAATGK